MSEFGKGYAYCLGLFLAHADRIREKREYTDASMWFYASVDHLFELQIPVALPDSDKVKIQAFVDRCCGYRFNNDPTWQTAEDEIQFAKNLLLEWDKFLEIPCEKGDYE